MRLWLFIALIMVLCAGPADAGLDRATINEIGARPGPLARLPLDLALRDESGAFTSSGAALASASPTALVFVDYHCRNLCGVGLPLLIDAFEKNDASACRIVAISLDPRATPADAVTFRRAHFARTPCRVRLLMGDERAIMQATRALGYVYRRDGATGDFAHDASVYVLRGDGSVAALITEFALQGDQLDRALVSARREDGFFDAAWRCICYAFDPAQGLYTRAVLNALALACLTLLAFGLCVLWRLMRRTRHAA